MLKTSPFWFKRVAAAPSVPQRNITFVQVEEVGAATQTDIIALYALNDDKTNADPNTLALYGEWTGTPGSYGAHNGILADNGFNKFLTGGGLQTSNWGAGTLDTYYNTNGMTFSWIARPSAGADDRLMQYWQADLEFIDLYFLDADTLRLSVTLGTGTTQNDDIALTELEILDGNFHHFVVAFNPAGDRIARLYIDGVLKLETAAVTGTATFGDEATNIRRGIGFGCSYTAPDDDYSGPIDHATILLGEYTPTFTGLDNRMLYNGNFMRYYSGQMYYTE
jgi:hypothetical protein